MLSDARIGKLIKDLRESMGMTQQELADKVCNMESKAAISKIENGSRKLRISNIEDFAKALGVSPGYLLGWETKFNSDKLTPDEKKLIDDFRKLSDIDKGRLLERLSMMLESQSLYRKQA